MENIYHGFGVSLLSLRCAFAFQVFFKSITRTTEVDISRFFCIQRTSKVEVNFKLLGQGSFETAALHIPNCRQPRI